jgi:hypothetical protein
MQDPELDAMSTIADALSKVSEPEAQARVLRWAADRFGVKEITAKKVEKQPEETEPKPDAHKFDDFVDLFDAVNPTTDVERALTGAYWLQALQGGQSWQSYQVNTLLKDTGHGIGNITDALDGAQSRKPALVRQMAKSGKSKQARKTYKLTTSGVSYIAGRIGSTSLVAEEE